MDAFPWLRFRQFRPDYSETYLRALLIMKRPWASLQGLPTTTSSAYLRKEANDSEKRSEVWRVKITGKELHLEEHHSSWDCARYLVVCPTILATTGNCGPIYPVNMGDLWQKNLSGNPWRGSVLNALLESRCTALKRLHPLTRCEFVACVEHETASRLRRFAFYANWCGSLGRVVMEPILFSPSDSRT